ncbi:Eco47II family restriction endonuclease [Moraxella catarrhalis]|uniref:Eco47II family restriction endonuclease n=1 Tax=Moraxella catarrhalis TaxID=480 RepID=UPI0007E33E3F|nr:Eco47II family restriction endonuclease [Moraxella catarrhalis]OAV04953.1 Type II restriction enzyme Eco47II [Moraxella catarrhalis]
MNQSFDRQKIKNILKPILLSAYQTEISEQSLRQNTLDVFSATLESILKGISFDEWIEQEKKRQIQKTLQNKVGDLHQKILGTLSGVQDLGVGGVVDIISQEKSLIAEIKNKHNTTKGNHKIAVYDDLKSVLSSKPEITTAYYVEILPKNGKKYNKPFTPSDNKTSQQRPANEFIRQIDGQSFYELLTGNPNALRELYILLAQVASEILSEEFNLTLNYQDYINEKEFNVIYGKNNLE